MDKLREHFRLRNLSFHHDNPASFVTCRITNNRRMYLVWRFLWACYHLCWLIGGLAVTSSDKERDVSKWWIYLSHWVYFLLVIGCMAEALMLVVVGDRQETSKQDEGSHRAVPIPWYMKTVWCLSSITSTGCVMVTLWYWSWEARGKTVTGLRLHYHGVNAVYVILNIIISKMPLRLLHFVYPMAIGFLYTAFTAVYFFCGGTNQTGDDFIYKILDWSRPGRTVVMSSLSNCVFIPIVHILLCSFSVCVEKLCRKYLPRKHDRIENVSCEEC